MLFILTVARDGAVPVQFRVQSGNVTDDTTHRDTWDLLCQLTGRRDFLYVADCKLATAENMAYLHQHGGRFLSVLPRTRGEDAAFRESLARGQVTKRPIYDKTDEEGELLDRYSLCEPATLSAEGYRLIWFHSTSKAEHDADARQQQVARTTVRLSDLQAEARLAADAVSPAGEGRGGGGRDPPGVGDGEVVHDHDRGARGRDVSPGRTRPADGADAVREAGQDPLRVELPGGVRTAGGGGRRATGSSR